MTGARVERGDLSVAATDVVARPVRSDGTAVTASGRRIEVAAGPVVARQLAGLGEMPIGGAVLTPGGGLRAPYLLHLVVQSSEEPVSAANVRRALALGLERVVDWGLSSLALPPLGTGAGALEPEDAARLLAEALREHERMGRAPLDVLVVVETEYERDVFARVLGEPAPPPG